MYSLSVTEGSIEVRAFLERKPRHIAASSSSRILRVTFSNLTYSSLLGERGGNSLPYFREDLLFLAGAVENDRASSSLPVLLVFFLPPPRCSSIVGIDDQLPSLSRINLHDFHFARGNF